MLESKKQDGTSTDGPLSVAIFGSPAVGSSIAYSILDVLGSVGRDWEMLHGEPACPQVFKATLLSVDGAPYEDMNGRTIVPEGVLADYPAPDIIIVPDLHVDPGGPVPQWIDEPARWVAEAYDNGAIVASACSGALLLAAAGVLDGREATTHWGYADALIHHFPAIHLQRERILVQSGDGHRVITAGGASAWTDLMLHLIGRMAGAEQARRIAKLYLLEPHEDGQRCYASLASGKRHEDRLIADAQLWIADHYHEPNPVGAMAARSGLSERGFLRRFRRATGQSPAEYVQTLRVEEAKQMLETTATSIEDIAAECGYSEPSSFRSAFRKHVGIPASAYRRKWRGVAIRWAAP
ncbi:helix-turn-helix domain-containing protein [Hwanghaeella grinnelliae]|uniref:Helix-turn-helix domain-containing protein n=1 Tax=Hwanghaeella grinnelliae TaxID=2500179 RepID=A0A3S2VRS0_9PROT|nr:helix-turn-helix domain-containing protein [Hwanghaeella grinnelliae]RVU38952.1 helix-turn-helix domain-containing protein [Hwanghaeella grinnelliae]